MTLDEIISKPTFGNLAKLTVLAILILGFAVSGAVVVIRGGDLTAYVEGAKTLGIFALSALAGGITTTVGKSETAKTILAQTEPVKTDSGAVYAAPAGSPLLEGEFDSNQAEAGGHSGEITAATVVSTDPDNVFAHEDYAK